MKEVKKQDSRGTPGGRKRLWPRLALLFGTCLFLLLLLEAGLRISKYAYTPARYFDPEIGYRFFPDQTRRMAKEEPLNAIEVRINEAGFRGPYFMGPKDPRKVRIACMGDSYTFGWAVREDESYPHLLQRNLDEIIGPDRIEVMNFGLPGYNTTNELRQYRKIVRAWKPDLVILGYVLNDTSQEDLGIAIENPILRWLARSAVFEAYNRHIRSGRIKAHLSREEKKQRLLYKEHQVTIHADPLDPVARLFWKRSMATLKELVLEVKADGSEFLLVSFPASIQWTRWKHAVQREEKERERLTSLIARPQTYLARRAKEMDVPFLNLLPFYTEQEEMPLGPFDPQHPNGLGCRIAAERITQVLQRHLELERFRAKLRT